MNEKIKKLKDQATTRKFDGTGTDMGKLVLDEEKFAELIVRECADYAEYLDLPGYKANMLKKHFGVEE